MSGLILFSFERNRFMNFAKSTPDAVAKANDTAPRMKMKTDWGRRKCSAWVLAPTQKPSRIVTMSIREFRAVFASRSVTPLSSYNFV